ncbi:MAG TPA: hypothetical protein VFJ07_22225 [Streptosporangiaceae bacterium]|nr:hypothetical protein [Streptosporangiaceae bacterium]
MMVFNRLAVVLAATVTGVMSAVTLPAAAAPAAGATAGGTAATAARGIRHPLWVATFHGPPGGKSQAWPRR